MMKFKTKPNRPQLSEGGYTIIESLVAMIMVSTLMAAIAPIIALSVGTRVQARRVELAAQAARSYIDWVRSDVANNSPNPINGELDDAGSPTSGNLQCNDGEICTIPNPVLFGFNDLYCVDGDGDGECQNDSLTDMVVQGFRDTRNNNNGDISTVNDGYALGIRVYRADAFQETTLCPLGTDCPDPGTQQSAVTNAIGNRRLPMVEMTTEITPTNNSFQNYRDRLD